MSNREFIIIFLSLLVSCSFVMNAGLIDVSGEKVWSYSPPDVAKSYGKLKHGFEYKEYSIITRGDGMRLLIPKVAFGTDFANDKSEDERRFYYML